MMSVSSFAGTVIAPIGLDLGGDRGVQLDVKIRGAKSVSAADIPVPGSGRVRRL